MEMSNHTAAAMAVAVIAAVLLAYGGIRLALRRATRTRGYLMLGAAAVILMNVMIWTV